MLILTRKIGEKIVIGDGITITLLGCNGAARFGIEAPADVQILRQELHERFEAGEPQRRQFPRRK